MKKNNKAQIALETIMIYGTAILVVTIAIGALIYFGVLDLGKLLPDKCSLGSGLQCENYQVSSSGSIQLEIRNRVGKNIVVSEVKVEGVEDWQSVTCTYTPTATETIPNGQVKLFPLENCGLTPTDNGQKIKAGITVKYTQAGSEIEKTASGELQATVAS